MKKGREAKREKRRRIAEKTIMERSKGKGEGKKLREGMGRK